MLISLCASLKGFLKAVLITSGSWNSFNSVCPDCSAAKSMWLRSRSAKND